MRIKVSDKFEINLGKGNAREVQLSDTKEANRVGTHSKLLTKCLNCQGTYIILDEVNVTSLGPVAVLHVSDSPQESSFLFSRSTYIFQCLPAHRVFNVSFTVSLINHSKKIRIEEVADLRTGSIENDRSIILLE